MSHANPMEVWLSRHFRLFDFLGSHAVYAQGIKNVFDGDDNDPRLENARALCEHGLEPILDAFGPISMSYGFISPEFSRRTVTYMNPNEPSNHRWDLGAAVDLVAHDWVTAEATAETGYVESSPALFAHRLDELGIPFRRLITYSESPFVCLSIKSDELDAPLKSFYENEYTGRPADKPNYLRLSSDAARQRRRNHLMRRGLQHPWFGGGYPTYHGGGRKRYQHERVSRYTTVLDWLANLQSISNGHKNCPAFHNEQVLDSFAAAGLVYDAVLSGLGRKRISILQGYVCRTLASTQEENWRGPRISFCLGADFDEDPEDFCHQLSGLAYASDWDISPYKYGAVITVDKAQTLNTIPHM